MQLVVLGSGTSVFHPRRAAPAFWLETEVGSLLLDCSVDAPHRMAEESLEWPNLDAIWISHLHLDHCAGLAPFLFGIKWASGARTRTKPLRIFGCTGVENFLRSIDAAANAKLFEQRFAVEIHEVAPAALGFEVLPGVKAEVQPTPHRPESLAIRLTTKDGAKLVYTSDTGFSEPLAQFAHQSDLLILECSFYRNKPAPKHLELAEAMRMAHLAEPRKLLLTHLYSEWDGINLESEAKKFWPGATIAAYDGLRLNLGRV